MKLSPKLYPLGLRETHLKNPYNNYYFCFGKHDTNSASTITICSCDSSVQPSTLHWGVICRWFLSTSSNDSLNDYEQFIINYLFIFTSKDITSSSNSKSVHVQGLFKCYSTILSCSNRQENHNTIHSHLFDERHFKTQTNAKDVIARAVTSCPDCAAPVRWFRGQNSFMSCL